MTGPLHAIDAWVLDVDGCLMRTAHAGGAGGTPMPDAVRFVSALKAAGHEVVICTNASEQPPGTYAEHLRAHGFDIADDHFVTAGSAAADFIAREHPGARVLVVGEEGLRDPLRRLGVALADPGDLADVVVVGAARSYGTAELNAAGLAVDAGAPLYTTVDVRWFHGGLGKSICASAAIANAIGWVAGAEPRVLGKPSPALAATLAHRLGRPPGRVAVVGDALVEVRLARHMGAHALLVLSGATTPEQLDGVSQEERPDAVYADVAELYRLLTPHLTMSEGVTA
ncbi:MULTISPECIES: HAD-IIA family hydrolase [unclassified Microbispora]|uniref:HAD-IIA family hydrolase n=1 Tax=unclassified Microbispora TaxID=2614687 RepID=UPI0014746C94|nr:MULTISPECIES: HAD hydrolase-like protein [unclassified Microbispora]